VWVGHPPGVYGRSGGEVGVLREGVAEVSLSPHPSKTEGMRHAEIQRQLFGWCGRVGHPPIDGHLEVGSGADHSMREMRLLVRG